MPIVSKAQRRWMWATHPEMARRWERHTPRGKRLPERVGASLGGAPTRILSLQFPSRTMTRAFLDMCRRMPGVHIRVRAVDFRVVVKSNGDLGGLRWAAERFGAEVLTDKAMGFDPYKNGVAALSSVPQYEVYVFRDVATAARFTHECDQEHIPCRQKNNTVQVKVKGDRSFAWVADQIAAELGGNKIRRVDTPNTATPSGALPGIGRQGRLIPQSKSKMWHYDFTDSSAADQFARAANSAKTPGLTVHAQVLEGTRNKAKYPRVKVEVYVDPYGKEIRNVIDALASRHGGHALSFALAHGWRPSSLPTEISEEAVKTRRDIVRVVADELRVTQTAASPVVKQTLDTIADVLVKNGRVELRGFGVFELRIRRARRAVDPSRGHEGIVVPDKVYVVFKPSKLLNQRIRPMGFSGPSDELRSRLHREAENRFPQFEVVLNGYDKRGVEVALRILRGLGRVKTNFGRGEGNYSIQVAMNRPMYKAELQRLLPHAVVNEIISYTHREAKQFVDTALRYSVVLPQQHMSTFLSWARQFTDFSWGAGEDILQPMQPDKSMRVTLRGDRETWKSRNRVMAWLMGHGARVTDLNTGHKPPYIRGLSLSSVAMSLAQTFQGTFSFEP